MATDNAPHWFVMTLLNTKLFRDLLKTENAQRLATGKTLIEPFYPTDFLKKQESIQAQHKSGYRSLKSQRDEEVVVSEYFSRFVFLKGTESDIDSLIDDKHNSDLRIGLMRYLDTDGTSAIVPDKMMHDFLQACVSFGGRFEIAPPLRSVETMDKVRIISGPFAGHEASVTRVQFSHGAIHLDLSIQMVSGVMNIRMTDVKKNQIAILSRDTNDAIRTDFIEYTQNHLLTILEHRIKRVDDKTVNQRDADMLTRLYRYRRHQVKNEAARYHFMALMLICAHLCRYTEDEIELRDELMEILAEINGKSESKASTDTRTYIWIALYISTNNPAYRDAAKEYIRLHQPKSAKLRRFVSLIRTGKKV